LKVILAVGNPGTRYQDTRHNVGWWLGDHLVRRWSLPPLSADRQSAWTQGIVRGESVRIIRPLTYVNRSGVVVRPLLETEGFEVASDFLVLVDDVSLPTGRFRFRGRGSAGGHNGLQSIEDAVDGSEYGRLRIGVGSKPDPDIDLADWVLSPMSALEEEQVLFRFGRMAEGVECWIEDGMADAMNRFNAHELAS
jgi:peptidyl-tRNA hydrolase, PTH1 family